MRAKELNDRLQIIRQNLDQAYTPSLSKIKEILKRIYFADIENEKQSIENEGVFYIPLCNKPTFILGGLDYTIDAGKSGMAYGVLMKRMNKEKEEELFIKKEPWTPYARFVTDLISNKIVFDDVLNEFIKVDVNTYQVVTELDYTPEPKRTITHFFETFQKLFEDKIVQFKHSYTTHPYTIAGSDWLFDCKKLGLQDNVNHSINDLFVMFHPIEYSQINYKLAVEFIGKIANDDNSIHNMNLLHAYVLFRKLKLVPPEKWFILKDFGRTGKGLFIKALKPLFKSQSLIIESLIGGGFEAMNAWATFKGAELIHANETGEINDKYETVIRKIATGEIVPARLIGGNNFTFKSNGVLILDTNKPMNIQKIAANTSRVVKIALKDRPKDETEQERHKFFRPYWEFVEHDEIVASMSFLVASLGYLAMQGGTFEFRDTVIKNYARSEELTESQEFLLIGIAKNGFVLAKDEMIQALIYNDYGGMRFDQAKKDLTNIGVIWNRPKKINGMTYRTFKIGDEKLFKESLKLLGITEDYKSILL